MKLSTSVEAKQSKQELIANALAILLNITLLPVHPAMIAKLHSRRKILLTFTAPDCLVALPSAREYGGVWGSGRIEADVYNALVHHQRIRQS